MKRNVLAAITVFSLSAAASADPSGLLNPPILKSDFDNWRDGKYATGNWGGLRDDLAAHGIEPFVYYTGILSGNPSGGQKRGTTYVDDTYFGLNVYLDKLIGWKGAEFTISGVNRDGVGLSNNFIGSQYNVQQTVGGQNIFFYQLTLEQHLFNDKLSVKLGRFGASDDFNASPIYSYYVNNGIDGDIRNVLFDTQFSAYPFATWAARVRLDPSPEYNAEIGVFQAWTNIFNSSLNGVNWGIHSADGVILMAQAAWTPEFFKQPVEGAPSPDGKTSARTEMKGFPGHFWLGSTFSPWNGYSQFGTTRLGGDSYGFYAHADQMVYQKKPGSDVGLTLWTAFGLLPAAEHLDRSFPDQRRGDLQGTDPGPRRRPDHPRRHLRTVQQDLCAYARTGRRRRSAPGDRGRDRLPDSVDEVRLHPARSPMGVHAGRYRAHPGRLRARRRNGDNVLTSRAPQAARE